MKKKMFVKITKILIISLFIITSTSYSSDDYDVDVASNDPEIKYKNGIFTVTFYVNMMDDKCKGKNCEYVGVTLKRASDAFHFDFPAKAITPGETKKPITFSYKVGPGFVEYRLAHYKNKYKCKKNKYSRHGCKKYGYVLGSCKKTDMYCDEHSIWSHPGMDFKFVNFASINKGKILLVDGGAGKNILTKSLLILEKDIDKSWKMSVEIQKTKDKKDRYNIEILYRAKWDRGRAWNIAKILRQNKIGIRWKVKQWSGATSDFVVVFGK